MAYKLKETDLAASVVAWLHAQHYTVYQEVKIADWVADIVVDVAGRSWIIECKTSLSLAVLGQAWRWLHVGAANRVSVATPQVRATAGTQFACEICRRYGIGRLNVCGSCRQDSEPRFFRLKHKRRYDALAACRPEHINGARAGTDRGGYWTPFRQTMSGIQQVLGSHHGWMTLRELMDRIAHHYCRDSTARSSLRQWLTGPVGKSYGIESSCSEGKLLFRMNDTVFVPDKD